MPTAQFPGALATDATLAIAGNRIQTTLAAAMSATATVISLSDTTGIVVDMLLSIDSEIVFVTSLSPLTVTRAFDSTVAASHRTRAVVSVRVDAWHHNVLSAEIKAIETALGANLANTLAGPYANTARYNFAAQAPGGALVIGLNVVTLTPVPLGVNGSDANHYLYISNGTGAAEAVLMTAGGTAVSGAASGTVFVTCANTHSGAWTIASATAGIQEALQASGASGAVLLPDGYSDTYAAISLTASYQALLGQGEYTSIIRANFNSGHIIKVGAAIAAPTFDSFGTCRINGYSVLPSSGDTIQLWNNGTGTYAALRNLYLRHNYNGLNFVASAANCGAAFMQNIRVEGAANSALIGFLGSSNTFVYVLAQIGSTSFGSTYSVAYTPTSVINLGFADGAWFYDTWIGGPATVAQILFSAPATSRIGLVSFSGMQVDAWTGSPALVFSGAVGTDGVSFTNCDWSTSTVNVLPVVRVLTAAADISFRDCQAINVGGSFLDASVTDTAVITNLEITSCRFINCSNNLPLIKLGTQNHVNIVGNKVYIGGGGIPTYCLVIPNAVSVLNVVANDFTDYATAPILVTGTLTLATIANNNGVDNLPVTVASAASVLLSPGFAVFVMTGTTGVGAFTGLHEGRRFKILTNGGAVVFTAGATIGNTLTSVQNVPVEGVVIAGKVYLK